MKGYVSFNGHTIWYDVASIIDFEENLNVEAPFPDSRCSKLIPFYNKRRPSVMIFAKWLGIMID
jgi:hypothetical protein